MAGSSSHAEGVPASTLEFYVASSETSPIDSCGSNINPCSLASVAHKIATISSPQPAVIVYFQEGVDGDGEPGFVVEEAVAFTYNNSISFLPAENVSSVLLLGASDTAQLVLDVSAFFMTDFSVSSFSSGAIVLKERTITAKFERCRLAANRIQSRGGAAVTFYGQDIYFIDSEISGNEAYATSSEERITGGAVLMQVNPDVNVPHSASFDRCSISSA
jgi:hypothetical protein